MNPQVSMSTPFLLVLIIIIGLIYRPLFTIVVLMPLALIFGIITSIMSAKSVITEEKKTKSAIALILNLGAVGTLYSILASIWAIVIFVILLSSGGKFSIFKDLYKH